MRWLRDWRRRQRPHLFVDRRMSGNRGGDGRRLAATGTFDLLAGQVVLHGEFLLARGAGDGDHVGLDSVSWQEGRRGNPIYLT